MAKDDEKGETNDKGETFDDGFKEAEVKAVDEFADNPADSKTVEAKPSTVVTEKPAETEAKPEAKPKPKEPEPTAPEVTDFLTDDERTELAEAEKKSPGISKIIQRTRSWDGRLKKTHSQLVEAQTQLAQRESDEAEDPGEEAPAGEEKPASAPAPALSEEEQQVVDELANEYPVINKAMGIQARLVAEKVVDERMKPVEEASAARDRASSETHFSEIAGSHEDFYELSSGGAVDDWIETLPHHEAKQLLEIRKRGSTSQVIALLDRFKEESGYKQPVPETTETKEPAGNGKDKGKPKEPTEAQKAKRTAALAASEAVPRHTGGPPAAEPDDTDFDGGFNESSRRPDD